MAVDYELHSFCFAWVSTVVLFLSTCNIVECAKFKYWSVLVPNNTFV